MNNYLTQLKSKNIHVVGVSGAEGSAITVFLAKYEFKKVTCHDFCEARDFKKNFFAFHDALTFDEKERQFTKLRRTPYKFYFKDEYLKNIEKADVIFVPQSWFRYSFNEKLKKVDPKKLSSITKLYFNLSLAPIIAITGTSGKSTTTRLVYEICKKGKKKTYFTGNDRENKQILENIFDIKPEDVLVIEVSNRQLMIDLGKSPKIGVVTNITPNHLDDHGTFVNYIKTKKSLFKYQRAYDFAVLNFDNEVTRKVGENLQSRAFYFSTKIELSNGAFLRGKDLLIKKDNSEYKICSMSSLQLKGRHNVENVLAAALAGFLFGINTKAIRQAVMEFKGLKSRLELVTEIKGVKYYEDSSACNPDGAKVAVESFSEQKILIAGGDRKKVAEGEFEEMAKAIVKTHVKILLLIGKKALLIKDKVKDASILERRPGPIIQLCETLEEAVLRAYKSARRGDVVLLSPGCESFDMFRDYRDRARKFRRAVLALK